MRSDACQASRIYVMHSRNAWGTERFLTELWRRGPGVYIVMHVDIRKWVIAKV